MTPDLDALCARVLELDERVEPCCWIELVELCDAAPALATAYRELKAEQHGRDQAIETWTAQAHRVRDERDAANAEVSRLTLALQEAQHAATILARDVNPKRWCDHACGECPHDQSMTIAGFRCAYHTVKSWKEPSC